MTVTVTLPKFFKKYAGGQQELSIHATTMGELFSTLCAKHPELKERLLNKAGHVHPYLALFLNKEATARDNLDAIKLEDHDEVEVIAMAVGGNHSPSQNSPKKPIRDVRMKGFRQRISVDQALAHAYQNASPLPSESIHVTDAAGRVLSAPISSPVNVPAFRRSAMDGYAIQAQDSFGATLYDPLPLTLIGEVLPGKIFRGQVGPGQCVRIMTGAPVPDGADAVLKAEDSSLDTSSPKTPRVLVQAAISPGKNVGRIGEDIQSGQELFKTGRKLRAQDIGVLASIGQAQVPVVRQPKVRLIATGNELLDPGETPSGAQIVDSNTPMLRALLPRDGATLEMACRLPDNKDEIKAALLEDGPDVIIATGGTSVGAEDYLPILVQELGELPVHGIAMRPSAPTGIGRVGSKTIFLLPGNPVSCLCAYDFFAAPLLRRLAGLPTEWPHRSEVLPLKRRIASQIGRVDYVRVAVQDGQVDPIAISGASVLSSTCRADGFVITPEGSEGMPEGESVRVYFYQH